MKFTRNLITASAFIGAGILLNSCTDKGGERYPVNEQRAQEHIISLDQADQYVRDFGREKEELAKRLNDSGYLDSSFNLPRAEMFNKDAISLLLRQDGADGVRIYFGRDDSGRVRLVLLPVDAKGNDIRKMLITDAKQAAATKAAPPVEGQAIEAGQRCPTLCDEGFN